MQFRDDQGDVLSLPASWTDVVATDPFLVISQGRSAFRAADLIALAALIDRLQNAKPLSPPESVKEILPDV